jgi:tRNA-dihydrouridine synthase 3
MGHIVGLATSFLSGSKEEWSLVRRHPSETVFGVQVAGSKPTTLVPTAEIIARESSSSGIDFVDLNCGCPIDLVFKTGSGSARTLFVVSVLKQNVEKSLHLQCYVLPEN